MKKIIFSVVTFFVFTFVFSQAYEGNGDKKLQLGLNAFGYGSGITGSFDYGLSNIISIGAGAQFYFNNNDNSNDNFFLYGRANFHLGEILNMPREMDLYPGLNLGVHGDELGIGAHVGFRYFFTDKLGVFVELGNHGSLGISINF